MICCLAYNINTEEAAFEGDTRFQSIEFYLTCHPYIQKLKFSNVALINSHLVSHKVKLSLPYLRELQFYGSPTLEEDEYFLLDWINKNVDLPRLQSFSFTADIRFWNGKGHPSSSRFSKVVDPLAVVTFLYKHSKTLRNLTISGPHLKLIEPDALDNDVALSPHPIQLNSLTTSLDISELTMILDNQVGLYVIRCDRYQFADETVARNLRRMYKCIQRNDNYLKYVDITPVFLDSDITASLLDKYKIDCRIFQECTNLCSLKLRMNFLTSLENWQHSVPGKVINVHLLPNTLSALEIWTDKYDVTELDLFQDRFQEFTNLRTFYLTCLTESPFPISSSWVKKMLNLNLISAIFMGGELDDIEETLELVKLNKTSKLYLTCASNCRVIFENNDCLAYQ